MKSSNEKRLGEFGEQKSNDNIDTEEAHRAFREVFLNGLCYFHLSFR